jgi:hypothetical protein
MTLQRKWTAATDPVAEAKAIVERYLELSMVPDPEGASAFSRPASRWCSPAGAAFPDRPRAPPSTPSAMPGSRSASCAPTPRWTPTGDVHVYNTGYLYGAWPTARAFETNRYMDCFIVRDGKIVRTDVWNDSAEILLARPGWPRRSL